MEDIKLLRRELKRISDLSLGEHTAAMSALMPTMPHSCVLYSLAPDNDVNGYNCHAFSLKLHEHPLMRVKGNKEHFFGSFNKHWLYFYALAIRFMKVIEPGKVQDDDIICYLEEPYTILKDMRVIHSGRINAGVVTSKWGAKGHVWTHLVEHVPSSYEGHDGLLHVMYFRPDFEAIKQYFNDFFVAKSRR